MNSPIYLVSKGGDDILKIVGGVAFYVERFYEKSWFKNSNFVIKLWKIIFVKYPLVTYYMHIKCRFSEDFRSISQKFFDL